MLKKAERLKKAEFDRFFAVGKRFHSDSLQLIYVPSTEQGFQAAAVAGKKVSKSAVDRNRVRRRIYAALRALHEAQPLSGVYMVIAKPTARTASYQELSTTLAELVGKAHKAR